MKRTIVSGNHLSTWILALPWFNSIYIRTISSYCLLSALLTCFKQFLGYLGKATWSQEGIEWTKAKEWLRAYCPNIYTVPEFQPSHTHPDLQCYLKARTYRIEDCCLESRLATGIQILTITTEWTVYYAFLGAWLHWSTLHISM